MHHNEQQSDRQSLKIYIFTTIHNYGVVGEILAHKLILKYKNITIVTSQNAKKFTQNEFLCKSLQIVFLIKPLLTVIHCFIISFSFSYTHLPFLLSVSCHCAVKTVCCFPLQRGGFHTHAHKGPLSVGISLKPLPLPGLASSGAASAHMHVMWCQCQGGC